MELAAEKKIVASLADANTKQEAAVKDLHIAYQKKILENIKLSEEVHAVNEAKAVAAMGLKEERNKWGGEASTKTNALALNYATNCECSWCRPRMHLYDFEIKAKVCEKRKISSAEGLAGILMLGKPAAEAADKKTSKFLEVPPLTFPEPRYPHLQLFK